ncbi:MAG TPA: hypothetical protein VL992_15890, partial [Tepidisphaeraceae bacterium]|nr:hypothetical protein [Tepidisphaeraceae bacterium]
SPARRIAARDFCHRLLAFATFSGRAYAALSRKMFFIFSLFRADFLRILFSEEKNEHPTSLHFDVLSPRSRLIPVQSSRVFVIAFSPIAQGSILQ